MTFTLPKLPYEYDALAPFMSKETLEYHHDKHHQTYVDNANRLIKNTPFENKSLEEVVQESYTSNSGLFNNVAQHFNHNMFWESLNPPKSGDSTPKSLLKEHIEETFGSLEKFKENFLLAGAGQFGSGWVWLALDSEKKLLIMKTPNGENPLVHNAVPLLGIDVWEHSYYIDYRNRRADYLKAVYEHLINWDIIEKRLVKALS